jgi:hypothetical protein
MRVSGRRCAHACSAHAALECCLAPCQHHVPSRRQQAGAPAGSLADVPPPRLSPVPPAVRGGGAARPRLLRAVGGGAAGAAGGASRPPRVQPMDRHAMQRGICAAALTRLPSSGVPPPRCASVGRCHCPLGWPARPACPRLLQDCMAVRHEAVQEAVPENAKNMLLVMAASGILTPDWKVGGLWGRGHRPVSHLSTRSQWSSQPRWRSRWGCGIHQQSGCWLWQGSRTARYPLLATPQRPAAPATACRLLHPLPFAPPLPPLRMCRGAACGTSPSPGCTPSRQA